MSLMQRFDSFDEFRRAVSRLGLPMTEDELRTVWSMVQDLHDQADSLTRFLEDAPRRASLDRYAGRPVAG
jgi:hypothetical protein